jgi:hypothetical protein
MDVRCGQVRRERSVRVSVRVRKKEHWSSVATHILVHILVHANLLGVAGGARVSLEAGYRANKQLFENNN